MRKLEVSDVLALDDYLRVRDDLRARVRQARADRRVQLGELLSLTFENRDTVLFQIEEMIRVEQIRDVAPSVRQLSGDLPVQPHQVRRSGGACGVDGRGRAHASGNRTGIAAPHRCARARGAFR